MEEVNKKGIYELYEIFNDYNRLIILSALYNNVLSVDEIVKMTGLNSVIVFHQLEYLKMLNVVKKEECKKPKYKISDKTMKMIICRINNYSDAKVR